MEQVLVKVENLFYAYEPGKYILKNINLNIGSGEYIAIIGQNGAGKSTLLKNITGLLKPTSGRILVKGKSTVEMPVANLATNIGLVLQNPDQQLFASTVWEEVAFGPKNLGLTKKEIHERVEKALSLVGLSHCAQEFPPALKKGDRAKVVVASVLAMGPEIIILDEPTNGQDYKGTCQIMELTRKLHQAGHTIILVTHQMSLVAEYALRTVVLHQGEILLDGETREVFSHFDFLRKAKIIPPQITQLGHSLSQHLPLRGIYLTAEELGEDLLNTKKFLLKADATRTGTEG